MRHLMDVLGLSQRRACLIVGVARSSFQRAHKHAKDVVTLISMLSFGNGCIRGLHRILGGDIAVPGLKLKRKVLMWDGTWCGVCGVRKIFGFRRGNGRSRKPWRIPLPGWSQQHVRMMCGRWISSSIRTITAGQSRSAT